jgi:hypothetical protein
MPTICPCLLAGHPCSERCTCVHPTSSYGCACCATYGSKEQRRQKATHIVDTLSVIDDEDDDVIVIN